MTLTLLSNETYAQHVEAHYGRRPGRDTELIAEVMRRELLALGTALRWNLESRVRALLSHFGVTRDDVVETRQILESIGDVQSGPGGEIAPAPLRVVELGAGRWLLAGTAPSGEIRRMLEMPVTGLPRRVSIDDDERIQRFASEMGGRVIDVARFTGLDRAPLPELFFEELNERLESAGRYQDRMSALTWDALDIFEPSLSTTKVWINAQLAESATLVRAKQSGGWMSYGWACQMNAQRRVVPLSSDAARRVMLLYRARVGLPAVLPAVRNELGMDIHLPVMLPNAEYRWLAAMGEMLDGPRRVRLDGATFSMARAMLGERLCVLVEEGS